MELKMGYFAKLKRRNEEYVIQEHLDSTGHTILLSLEPFEEYPHEKGVRYFRHTIPVEDLYDVYEDVMYLCEGDQKYPISNWNNAKDTFTIFQPEKPEGSKLKWERFERSEFVAFVPIQEAAEKFQVTHIFRKPYFLKNTEGVRYHPDVVN